MERKQRFWRAPRKEEHVPAIDEADRAEMTHVNNQVLLAPEQSLNFANSEDSLLQKTCPKRSPVQPRSKPVLQQASVDEKSPCNRHERRAAAARKRARIAARRQHFQN